MFMKVAYDKGGIPNQEEKKVINKWYWDKWLTIWGKISEALSVEHELILRWIIKLNGKKKFSEQKTRSKQK